MIVRMRVHETVVGQIEPGQSARVRVAAFPDAVMEGEVVHVPRLPASMRSRRQSDEIKNFECLVALRSFPDGLLPGMDARVEIVTETMPDALVVPLVAVDHEGEAPACYVLGEDGIERRDVTLGTYHPLVVEVVDGLDEGDRVVTDLDRLASGPRGPGVDPGALSLAEHRTSW